MTRRILSDLLTLPDVARDLRVVLHDIDPERLATAEALARSLNIPARIVVGYLYQLEPMDLHAWFEAYVGGQWFTFDGVKKQPCGNRITIGYGRDWRRLGRSKRWRAPSHSPRPRPKRKNCPICPCRPSLRNYLDSGQTED